MMIDDNCVPRLDRVIFNVISRDKSGIKSVPGYKCLSDFRPHRQSKIVSYGRVRKFRSETNSSEIVIQYDRRVPWVAPQRVMMVGHDQTGLTLDEIESVISLCHHHTLTLVELAIDFPLGSGIDRDFVLRYGRFGKSRRRKDRGGPGTLRYGGRSCPKLVRCYLKESLGVFRVELECHGALLRKLGAKKVGDLGMLAAKLAPSHLRFACIRWKKLEKYLANKFGKEANRIGEETRRRAQLSLGAATRYLAKIDVPNPHRFLGSLKINRDVREALKRWAEAFAPDQWE